MANQDAPKFTFLSCAVVFSLAAAFTLAPAAVGFGPLDDTAHAQGKSGDKGNKGGKGGGKSKSGKSGSSGDKGKGGKSGDKGKKGSKGGKAKGKSIGLGKAIGNLFNKGKKKPAKVARPAAASKGQSKKAPAMATDQVETVSLHPSQKGRWNAANANQAALDAHIRNGNFNGTIGALAQYQLAGKAASGADLTDAERAALDGFVMVEDTVYDDADLEALLNGDGTDDLDGDGLNDTLPNFEVVDGTATCMSNCDADGYDPATIDADANQALEDSKAADQQAAQDQAHSDFLSASEQRILDDANKSTDGIEEQLLDELADQLGFERPDAAADEMAQDETLDDEALDDVANDSAFVDQAEEAEAAMLAFTKDGGLNF